MTEVSVIVPMKNEQGNVAIVVQEIIAACADLNAYEVIIIDDGSTDDTAQIVQGLSHDHPQLRLLQNTVSAGQSAAVHSGVLAARAPIICTLDGDGQNDLSSHWPSGTSQSVEV